MIENEKLDFLDFGTVFTEIHFRDRNTNIKNLKYFVSVLFPYTEIKKQYYNLGIEKRLNMVN